MSEQDEIEQVRQMVSSSPDVVAFGETVECPCGVLKLGPVNGGSGSVMARCPACSAVVEAVGAPQ